MRLFFQSISESRIKASFPSKSKIRNIFSNPIELILIGKITIYFYKLNSKKIFSNFYKFPVKKCMNIVIPVFH